MDVEAGTLRHRIQRRRRRRRDVSLSAGLISFICKGCKSLGRHNKRALPVFFLVLEAISLLLDVFGKSQKSILLAAFALSVFGFGMTLFTCIIERNAMATRVQAEKQLLVVEFVFSLVQLIATFLAVLGIKIMNSIIASVLLILFALIATGFAFAKDEEGSDKSRLANNISSIELLRIARTPNEIDGHLHIANAPNEIGAHWHIASTPNEIDEQSDTARTQNETDYISVLQASLMRLMNIWILRGLLMRMMNIGILQALFMRLMSMWIVQILLMRLMNICILQVFLMRLMNIWNIWMLRVVIMRLMNIWILQVVLLRLITICILQALLMRSMAICIVQVFLTRLMNIHLLIAITTPNETGGDLDISRTANEIGLRTGTNAVDNNVNQHHPFQIYKLPCGFWAQEPSLTLGYKRLRPLAPKRAKTDSVVTAFDLQSFIRPESGRRTLGSSDEERNSPQVETHPRGTRWNPTQEQIGILEMLYRGGLRTPNVEQIEQITAQLGKYGKIEGKNVFYWFQNHKARERQKLKLSRLGISSRILPPSLDSMGNQVVAEGEGDSP